MTIPSSLARAALGSAIAVAAWLALNLVVYLLVISALGPLGMAVRGDGDPPGWFRALVWMLQALLIVLSLHAGWRWAWRLVPPAGIPPSTPPPTEPP